MGNLQARHGDGQIPLDFDNTSCLQYTRSIAFQNICLLILRLMHLGDKEKGNHSEIHFYFTPYTHLPVGYVVFVRTISPKSATCS